MAAVCCLTPLPVFPRPQGGNTVLSLAVKHGDAAAARVALALVRGNVPADALHGHLLQADAVSKSHFLHRAAAKRLLNDAGFVAELGKLDGLTLRSLLTTATEVQ